MALTVSNNGAVAAASYYLGKNQDALQTSIKRLASGKKIVGGAQDPGTLAVSMKVNAAINRLSGAQNNIRNAQGFLEVQDGLIETTGKIVMRMSELKGYASQDPLKGEQDIASYDNEFKDLQLQLHAISQLDFNGTSLFARFVSDGQGGSGGNEVIFDAGDTDTARDHTLDIFTSTKGSDGSKVSIHKSALLSALTLTGAKAIGQEYGNADNNNVTANTLAASADIITLASADSSTVLTLNQVSSGIFEKALENVVFLRAQNGGGLSRLSFAGESMATQETNMRAALGRIEDVDIAAEAANLSKYSILMQASAAMVAQANSQNDVALMLLR
ncbi:flagellin [Opitutales bacterium]|nr:flagellin [Opitutales bacterium]